MTVDGLYDELKRRVPVLAVDPDDWVARMMRWHFSPETGSPFWIAIAKELGFDPRRDVRSVPDLARFGLFDKERLRHAKGSDLVPAGFNAARRRFFETGGTTGLPCRVVDVTTGTYNVAIYRAMLEARGLDGGDALAMTPSGPHAYGTFVGRLLDEWCGNTFYIDFDPRWVKALIRSGEAPDGYVDHLIAQTVRILEAERPALLFTTSKLLLALAATLRRPLGSLGVRAVCTGGTSCTPEERRFLLAHHLDGITWIDTYGNTLMGHALQADGTADGAAASYHLPPPQAYMRIVDPRDWTREVEIGQRGRVLLVTLLEDLFLPNLLERDSAIRTGPHRWFPWDGVRDVQPFMADAEAATEGVY
jgi:phenylacetate-coenzyme A ligase PaaK-like adenylate-forming protein